MKENSDELDLDSCSRRARRWAIGLACVLGVNFSLVALALAGFGVSRPQSPVAAAPASQPRPPAAAPVKAAPIVRPPVSVTPAEQPAAPPTPTPLIVARMVESAEIEPSDPSPPEEPLPPEPLQPDPPPIPPSPPIAAPAPPIASPPAPSPVPAPSAPIAAMPVPPLAPAPASNSLIIINPPGTGGAVHFLVDGSVRTLAPGEYCELSSRSSWRIEYHQGDDFGNATHRLEAGTHAFGLADAGWLLEAIETAEARRVLAACQHKTQ